MNETREWFQFVLDEAFRYASDTGIRTRVRGSRRSSGAWDYSFEETEQGIDWLSIAEKKKTVIV